MLEFIKHVYLGACESTSTEVNEVVAVATYRTPESTRFNCFQMMWDANMASTTTEVVTTFDDDTNVCTEYHFTMPITTDAFLDCASNCSMQLMSLVPCHGMTWHL